MTARYRLTVAGLVALLGLVLAGCGDLLNVFNPDFLTVVGSGQGQISDLPGEAPGLLVSVENRTSRWVAMMVSYQDDESNVRSFSSTLGPGDRQAQMLVCPVEEITLGNVADLEQSGTVVYLTGEVAPDADPQDLPFILVDSFGVLLRAGLNYECGDGLAFSVIEAPGQTSSGYRMQVEISHAE